MKPSGDLIPWNIREQFQDKEFPTLVGGRVVRIATHPTVQKMGYGSKTLEQLALFFEGKLITLDKDKELTNWDLTTSERVTQPLMKKLE